MLLLAVYTVTVTKVGVVMLSVETKKVKAVVVEAMLVVDAVTVTVVLVVEMLAEDTVTMTAVLLIVI
jgi:hypothetical protein